MKVDVLNILYYALTHPSTHLVHVQKTQQHPLTVTRIKVDALKTHWSGTSYDQSQH